MTLGGWIFMLTSVTCVLVLVSWCYSKLLGAAPDEPDDTDDTSAP